MIFPDFDLEFKKGETVGFTVYYKNINGTAFTESASTVTCSLAIKEKTTDASAAVTLTKGNGITYSSTDGSFQVVITAAQTSGIPFTEGVYDMWINSTTFGKDYVLDGKVITIPSVA